MIRSGRCRSAALQEIPDRHCRQAVLGLPGFEPNEILLSNVNLGGVLDQQDSFLLRYELAEDVESVVLPGPVPPPMRMFLRPST